MFFGTPEYWNGAAGQKWAASQELLDTVLEPFGQVLIEAADLPHEGTVIDVGCGCGATTLMAAARSQELEVVGIDVSRPMLEVARRRGAGSGLKVRFDEADASKVSMPVPVDRVISRFGVMFFREPAAAFRNIGGWLREGGKLAMLVWNPLPQNEWAAALVELARRHVALESPSAGTVGPFSLGDSARTAELLGSTGFVEVVQTALDTPMSISGTVDDVFGFLRERGPIVMALEQASARGAQAVLADLREFVAQHHDGVRVELPARARLVTASRA